MVARFAVAQTVWTVVVALLWIGGMMWLSADQDYTSGELLDHLLAWMSGELLYSDPQQLPYRVLNYPPLGLAAVHAWDFRTGEAAYRRAIEVDPEYPTAHQWYGELLYHTGRIDSSLAEIRRFHCEKAVCLFEVSR